MLGQDIRLVQPPLPQGEGEGLGELCGTEEWKITNPSMYSKRMKGMWILDVKMGLEANGGAVSKVDDEGADPLDSHANGVRGDGWFPSVTPFKIGLWMEEGTLEFGVPEVLDPEAGFNYHKL